MVQQGKGGGARERETTIREDRARPASRAREGEGARAAVGGAGDRGRVSEWVGRGEIKREGEGERERKREGERERGVGN